MSFQNGLAGVTVGHGVGQTVGNNNKARAIVGTAAGVGVGYTAASLISNPNGQVAQAVTKGATKAGNWINNAVKQITGSATFQSIKNKAGEYATKIKGTDAYKQVAGAVRSGVSKITNNSTFQKLVSTVRNSSIGKWVAANPKIAAGVAVATVVIGLVTAAKSKEA